VGLFFFLPCLGFCWLLVLCNSVVINLPGRPPTFIIVFLFVCGAVFV